MNADFPTAVAVAHSQPPPADLLSQHTTQHTTEHTNMEPDESAIEDIGAESAAAAASAAIGAPPQQASAAAVPIGQSHAMMHEMPTLVHRSLGLI